MMMMVSEGEVNKDMKHVDIDSVWLTLTEEIIISDVRQPINLHNSI